MPLITWDHSCYFCRRPITRGKPTILFATDKPLLLGISHSTCGATKYEYGYHQMTPPAHLSCEQAAFLIQYFPMLYSLPGGFEPNSDLRRCAANFHWDYPAILANPLKCVRDSKNKINANPGLMQVIWKRIISGFWQRFSKQPKKTGWMLSLISHDVCSKKANQYES